MLRVPVLDRVAEVQARAGVVAEAVADLHDVVGIARVLQLPQVVEQLAGRAWNAC